MKINSKLQTSASVNQTFPILVLNNADIMKSTHEKWTRNTIFSSTFCLV